MAVKAKKRFASQKLVASSGDNTEKMEKAQIWSIDVLLAVVIFISIIIIFYATIGSNDKLSVKELENEAAKLRIQLEKNPNLGFIDQDSLNTTKFDQFSQNARQDYDAVKSELGVRGDFCIYFEDENGYLVLVQDNRTGAGNTNISITGKPCGEKMW